MKTKKALLNSITNIISYIISFIPNLIIRKVFIATLGNGLLGLSSLFTNLIGWISIVELGVGTAIVYSLYKPFAENDKKTVNAYINFYRKFYRAVGFIILGIGILLAPFIKYFVKEDISSKVMIFGFLLYLINSFISYMFSHKLCILNVAQEAYKVTIGTTVSKLTIAILQYIMLRNYPDFFLYIIIQMLINILYYIIINIYILSKYSWLNDKKQELEGNSKKNLIKNVRALFMHKIGGLVVFSTDNIVISKFIGLTVLANYTNYQMIISALQSVVKVGISGITASVGIMLVEGDKKKAYETHKKIFFLSFWIVSYIIITLYNTLDQFIAIWIGKESFLNSFTVCILLINMYFLLMRSSVDSFQEGSGNFYQDRYGPIAEGTINLVMSIILVKRIGISGVFVGTLISNFLVVFWTKPYVVYKHVFKINVKNYFIMYFKYLGIALIPLFLTNFLLNSLKYNYNIMSLIINCIINTLIINLTYLLIFYKTKEFKFYKDLFMRLIKK